MPTVMKATTMATIGQADRFGSPSRASAQTIAEQRGAAMRALFPLLYHWQARGSAGALPRKVYARLAAASTPEEMDALLRQPLRRYPTQLIERVSLRDGRAVLVRPVRPDDAPMQQAFVRALSLASRRRRFHTGVTELSQPLLRYLTAADHVDHVALLAEAGAGEHARQVAEARWMRRSEEPQRADFAIAVADDYQGVGLGARLMDTLERSAVERGIRALHGSILRSNAPMVEWLARRGWRLARDPCDPSAIDAEFALSADQRGWREAA